MQLKSDLQGRAGWVKRRSCGSTDKSENLDVERHAEHKIGNRGQAQSGNVRKTKRDQARLRREDVGGKVGGRKLGRGKVEIPQSTGTYAGRFGNEPHQRIGFNSLSLSRIHIQIEIDQIPDGGRPAEKINDSIRVESWATRQAQGCEAECTWAMVREIVEQFVGHTRV